MSQAALRRLPAVLVVDDELRSQEALRRTLEEDFVVFCASGAAEGMEILEREQPAAAIRVILCDQRMPGTTGVQFLRDVRQRWPDIVRIILSGYTDAEDIITGVNEAGIWQYLLKPWQPEQLLLTLQRAAEVWRLQQENERLALDLRTAEPVLRKRVDSKQEKARTRFGLDGLVRAPGSPLEEVCALIHRVAPFDLSVMVTGESGTGKEMVARAIHYESRRAARPFITENCGAVPDSLLESELFGYKRGAFTGAVEDRVGLFQQADGGTLFLDEIGETSPAFQVKLLRALQEGEFRPLGSSRPVTVDVRVIAATNRDLEEDVRTGRFREDLYYRLATIPMHVPPLRQRPMDLPLLAAHLLEATARILDKPVDGIEAAAMQALAAYQWPGNVRELQNEILRMVALADAALLGRQLLSPRVLGATGGRPDADAALPTTGLHGNLRERMEQLEQRVIAEAMQRHRGNKSRAARELGLSRVGLRAKLNRYGLEEAEQ
ncbi:MAG: sigma-54-dependent Fis family transcriptional regulator [Betaproteobacteria bacterium HGW-Betaproteobacteria-7]|jgi:two-component system response regulator HupR/HoxA|nr:MAG: sigma-54-dependent Fis family transcriptional regulator [Betaproteobacteria bacterium HGW-Betaproteobacteria-7]